MTGPSNLAPVLLVACSAFGTVACASQGAAGPGALHPAPEEPSADQRQVAPPPERPVPEDIVLRSQLPGYGVELATDTPLSSEALMDALAQYHVVCLAEQHSNPHHHYAQLLILQEVFQRAELTGKQLGLGMEMFQLSFQAPLDAYASGELSFEALLAESEYETRWGWPAPYYRPQIEHAHLRQAALIALNAPKEWTRPVAKQGLDALAPEATKLVGELDLEDEEHRAQFDRLMQGHPHGHQLPHAYAAQTLWDETMAATAQAWVGEGFPARQLLIMAGAAHCHRSAIPRRLQRRLEGVRIASVLPHVAPNDSERPPAEESAGYDYLFVMHAE